MYVFLRETPSVGRPSIQINIEEVEFLRALHLLWIRIAEILDISRHTLYRWLKNEGILQELQFTEISDNDLDEVMKGIKEEHPNDGEVLVSGHLLAKGIRVPRSRMRASIHRVDPISTLHNGGVKQSLDEGILLGSQMRCGIAMGTTS